MNKRNYGWICWVWTILLTSSAAADGLPRTQPQELGFSAERLGYIDQFFADKVKKGELAGIVTLVARHGKIAHFSAVGYADVEKKRKLETDSIFRLYSMTKPIASTALMMLYEQGRFQMRDPLSKYIPEFANLRVLRTPDGALDDTVAMDQPPTVQDAFRHTAGFTHGLMNDAFDEQYVKGDVFGLNVNLAEMMTRLAKIPLRYQPGTKFVYSVGPDIQARLVEVLSGMPFDRFLETRLFTPLGMKDAGFWVQGNKVKRLATVHWSKDGKLTALDKAHGQPQGSPLFLFDPASVNSYTTDNKHKGGSYGLVATAEDYWRFAQMMLNGGQFNGTRFLSPRTVQYMARDHLTRAQLPEQWRSVGGFGLGFAVVKDPAVEGVMTSEGSFHWAGAAATHFWIDPKEDMVVVAMTQHMSVPAVQDLSNQVRTLVYSALME